MSSVPRVLSVGNGSKGSRRSTDTLGTMVSKGAVQRRQRLNKCAQVTGSKVPGGLVNIL